ncbi:MAG TPA: hypothetical protein VND64_26370 [Pirellulales bacterium]|nr:hypothetical protein [Pirellulales bacterium]
MRSRADATRFAEIVFWALLSFAAWAMVTPPVSRCARADEPPAPSDARSAEATSDRVTVRVVLNADGSLAPGATVYVEGEPPRQTAADESGEFSFEHVRVGSRLWAKRGNLVSRSSRAKLQWVRNGFGPQRMRRVELQLYEPVTFNVRVRARSSGQAVAGAVVLHGGDKFDGGNFDDEFRTDASGEAAVGPLAPGNWQVEVHADGFALEQHSLDVKYDGQTDEFLLAPAGIVEGTVRGQAGQPLADVRLTAVLKNDGRRNFGSAVTNAEGHYRLPNVLRGAAVKIAIRANRWQTVVLTGERQTLDFVIAPGPLPEEMEGIVVDPLGRPIEGALLGGEARTDRDGRFHAARRLNSHGTIFVQAKGFVPRFYEPDAADVTAEARIVLQPGHRIDGRLVDESRQPLTDVDVRVDTVPFVSLPIVSTDGDGRFEYDTLPADCVFSFSKSGFRTMHHQELALDTNVAIPVVMQPPGVLFGQVVDAVTSRPIRDFHVRCSAGGLSVRLSDPGEDFRTADGTFEIVNDGLAIGVPIEVILDADGYERLVIADAKAKRRDEAEPVSFRLKPEGPTDVVTYAGRLLDAAGAPVVNAEVRLIGTAGAFRGFPQDTLPGGFNFIRIGRLASYANVLRFGSATTDQEGRFEFVRVPRRAAVDLAWWRQGVAPARRLKLEVLSDAERGALEIRVDAAARIVGPIDRTAFPGARRVAVTSDDRTREGASEDFDDDQETFDLTDLAPGAYRVQLLGPLEEAFAVRPSRGIPGFGGKLLANQRLPKKLAETTVTLAAGEVRRVEFGK